MQVPVRLLLALRPQVSAALLVATATSTIVFLSSPFLIPAVAEDQGVSIAAAGWISTSQLAGFVVASWVGGHFLRPIRRLFVAGVVLAVAANLASALAPDFGLLVATRFLSGLWLGLAAWFAWQEAFGDAGKTGDVAVVAPLVSVFVAPGVSALIETAGVTWVFVVLAALSALPLVWVRQVPRLPSLRPHRTRHAPTWAARAILAALGLITLGGSSVFVYGAAIGTELDDMDPVVVSVVYSLNALASIPAAKWFGRRGPAGMWFFGTALCALLIPAVRSDVVFATALIAWGFIFFMGVPAAFGLLAARSNFPEERAGDAQAIMALGRVGGPLMGGAFLAGGNPTGLGLAAATCMAAGAATLLYVDVWVSPPRSDRAATEDPPPSRAVAATVGSPTPPANRP